VSNKKRYEGYETLEETQHILSNYLLSGVRPTLELLQARVFGTGYTEGDYKQRQLVKKSIDKARTTATAKWIAYANSSNFHTELSEIVEKYPELVEKELSSLEYSKYLLFINDPLLSTEKKQELENTNDAALAVLFYRKIKKYSRQKTNLVITKGGRGARYFLPKYWEWCIREDILLIRKLGTLVKGWIRVKDTKAKIRSESQELLEEIFTQVPAITMRAVWKCLHCGEYSPKTTSQCSTCGNPREVDY